MSAYGADAESSRITRKAATVADCGLTSGQPDPCQACRFPTVVDHRAHTKTEFERMMDLANCIYYSQNIHSGGLCGPDRDTVHVDIERTLPHSLHRYRSYPRMRGIDEYSRWVRTLSSSELTARRRATVLEGHQEEIRHKEHFRTTPPPPANVCRVPRVGPQAGVPIAPETPCVLGNQRVDYENPH